MEEAPCSNHGASTIGPSGEIEVTNPPARGPYVVTPGGSYLVHPDGLAGLEEDVFDPSRGDVLVAPSSGTTGPGFSPKPRRPQAGASGTDTGKPEPTRDSGSATSDPSTPR